MDEKKQIVKSTDWLTEGYSEEEIARIKAEAVKEAEKEIRNKQIEEMANDLSEVQNFGLIVTESQMDSRNSYSREIKNKKVAEHLYNRNYRKQSEGEWIWINQAKGYLEPPYGDTCKCSLCEFVIDISESNYKFCPNCGAKMKGGKE